MNDVTGYIQVKAMWLFAALDVPKKRIDEVGYVDAFVETFHQMYEGDYITEEVKEVSKIMDMVMKDLSEMKSIIIDVRFNGGGQDAVSFEILSRFIPKGKLQIATQKLKYGNRFTPILPLYIDGKTNAFTKPVYVLTSKQTGSAAEALSIATMAMQHVKRIGSATSGAMSTALEKKLPNGWSFAISNEIYMDNKGKSYENIGVPVDYNLNYSNERQTFFRSIVNDLEVDKQNILKAISKLEEK
jgi:carboxyl-terminal processing protease